MYMYAFLLSSEVAGLERGVAGCGRVQAAERFSRRRCLRIRRDRLGSTTTQEADTMNGRPGVDRLIGLSIMGVERRIQYRNRSNHKA